MTPRRFEIHLEKDKRLKPVYAYTLKILYGLSKKEGFTLATDAYLSEKLNICVSYMRDIFDKLEEFGYLTRQTFSERWEKGWRKRRRIFVKLPEDTLKNV